MNVHTLNWMPKLTIPPEPLAARIFRQHFPDLKKLLFNEKINELITNSSTSPVHLPPFCGVIFLETEEESPKTMAANSL